VHIKAERSALTRGPELLKAVFFFRKAPKMSPEAQCAPIAQSNKQKGARRLCLYV